MRKLGHSTIVSGLSAFLLAALACAPAAAPAPTAVPAKPPAAAPAEKPAAAPPAAKAEAPKAEAKPAAELAAIAQLVEGAKKETLLKGQWSATSFGGAEGLDAMVAALNKKFGLNVKAQFTPGPNQQGMMERISQEKAAGKPASSDVYLGNSPAMLDAMKVEVLKPIDWTTILERPIPVDTNFDPYAPNNLGVAFATTIVGITYNTEVVKGADIPKKMEDVLDPKWKGKIASTPYASGMREFAADDMLGYEKTKNFAERLSKQVGGLIRCGEPDKITSREFVMLVFDCGGDEVNLAGRKGTPLGHTVVEEASVLHIRYAGVPLNSSAPNTATLLIGWLHTAEGQATLWDRDGMDLHTYPESRQREAVARVKSAGGKLAVNTPQRLSSLKDFAKTQKELEQILQQGSQ